MIKNVHYLVYDNRSGSTLLAALLHRYSGLNVSQECDFTHQILEYDKAILETEDQLDRFLTHMETKTRFSEMKLAMEGFRSRIMKSGLPLDKAAILQAFIEEYFDKKGTGAESVVVKAPNVYFHLDKLKALFPDLKFIHVFRDGRAVHGSKVRSISTKGKAMSSNPYSSAKTWAEKVALVKKLDSVIEVRYEELLRNTDETLNQVLGGLAIPQDKRKMVREQKDYFALVGDNQTHLHKNLLKKPDPTHVDKWKKELPASHIRVFETVAGKALVSLGYKLSGTGSKASEVAFFRLKHLASRSANGLKYLAQGKLVYKIKHQITNI